MIKLKENEQRKLLEMLLDDENYSAIRKELGLGERYNLKNLCEYYGGKLNKAYKLHRNNYKEEKSNQLTTKKVSSEILTKEEFFKTISMLSTQINNTQINNAGLIEESKSKKFNNNNVTEIISLPKVLPDRLQGENYVVKQISAKVIENVYNEFTAYCKSKKTFSTIELHSLALLEFIEKYRV